MKIKEYPISFLQSLKLRFSPVTNLSKNKVSLIVSLTSIPTRLHILPLTIRSLLLQSVLPEKIILWLHRDLKEKLPVALSSLQSDLFEIRYVELTCSHRKLIHSLEAFPSSVIVTCDDDLIYEKTWLERLFTDHQLYPEDIVAHECRRISQNTDGQWLPYKEWPTQQETGVKGMNLLPIGYGGVLYPPNSLQPQVTDVQMFMELAPKADDLWFKAMSFMKGTLVRRSSSPWPKPIPIIGSQKISLLKTNVREDGNREQWLKITNFFDIGTL